MVKRGTYIILAILAALPAAGQSLTVGQKAEVRALRLIDPLTIAGAVAGTGIQQWRGEPEAWGGGVAGYSRRLGSAEARLGVREAFGFAIDAALHTDPRQFPIASRKPWDRIRHAIMSTFVARTDSGRRTFNFAQVGGRTGAELVANSWYPAGDDSVGNALARVGIGLGISAAKNVALEFWPGLRDRIFHRHHPAAAPAPASSSGP